MTCYNLSTVTAQNTEQNQMLEVKIVTQEDEAEKRSRNDVLLGWKQLQFFKDVEAEKQHTHRGVSWWGWMFST